MPLRRGFGSGYNTRPLGLETGFVEFGPVSAIRIWWSPIRRARCVWDSLTVRLSTYERMQGLSQVASLLGVDRALLLVAPQVGSLLEYTVAQMAQGAIVNLRVTARWRHQYSRRRYAGDIKSYSTHSWWYARAEVFRVTVEVPLDELISGRLSKTTRMQAARAAARQHRRQSH